MLAAQCQVALQRDAHSTADAFVIWPLAELCYAGTASTFLLVVGVIAL